MAQSLGGGKIGSFATTDYATDQSRGAWSQ